MQGGEEVMNQRLEPSDRVHGRRRTIGVMLVSLALASISSSAAIAQDDTTKLGFVYWETKTDAFVQMARGGQAVGQLDPTVEVKIAAPDTGDPSRQAALFVPIAQTQTDGIVLQSLASDPLLRPIKDATDAGIPVVAIDAPPPADAGVGLFVTNDNHALGAQLAEKVLALVPADAAGSVIVGSTGVGVPPLDARAQGMVDTITALRPDLTIVGPISTMGTTATSAEVYAAWDGLLKANPDAVAVMAPSAQDATAWGLLARRAGFDLPSGGFDLEAGNLQAVKDGSVDYVMSPEHWLSGYIATKLLAIHAQTGEPLAQGLWNVGGLLVDASNVDEIIARQSSEETVTAGMAPIGDEQIANPAAHLVAWP
jgi:ABC-type sugar transport system substrate-binding protein